MSLEIQLNDEQVPVREGELARLAQRANEAHDRVADSLQQAVANALEVGQALLAAKEICQQGKFTAWLRTNFQGGQSTARRFMRLVANWDQLGGDLSRARDLSQRQIAKLLKGLPYSDGRTNRGRSAVAQLPAPTNTPDGPGLASSEASSAPADMAGGDPLEPIGRLLEQVVTELRRLASVSAGEAPYARHLLKPLEQICRGIPTRQWFWELMEA